MFLISRITSTSRRGVPTGAHMVQLRAANSKEPHHGDLRHKRVASARSRHSNRQRPLLALVLAQHLAARSRPPVQVLVQDEPERSFETNEKDNHVVDGHHA